MEAQNLQPILHPTCDDIQTEFPCSYFILTLSMIFPSSSAKRYFCVPSSFDLNISTALRLVRLVLSLSFSLNAFDRFVHSSKDDISDLCIHSNNCFALNSGSFISFTNVFNSSKSIDLISVIISPKYCDKKSVTVVSSGYQFHIPVFQFVLFKHFYCFFVHSLSQINSFKIFVVF